MGTAWTVIAVLVLAAAALHLIARRLRPAPHEWRPAPWADAMRRKVGGRWQYRPMTAAEDADQQARADNTVS